MVAESETCIVQGRLELILPQRRQQRCAFLSRCLVSMTGNHLQTAGLNVLQNNGGQDQYFSSTHCRCNEAKVLRSLLAM